MNISYKWLKRYLDTPLSPQEIAGALTSIGLETGSVEEVETIRGGLKGLVIGKVLTCTEHPDSDHLHVTTVDLGDGNATQIVCGAPNVAAGQTVVVATVGTRLYDGDKEFQIKKSKIRGVESFGMICAEDEIGTGTSHDGIIVIEEEVAPGTPAAKFFGVESDWVLEVDLTPNRIDAASHYGVARDLAAWTDCHATHIPLKRPSTDSFKTDRTDGAITVEVADTDACPRYSGVTIRGVKVAESPKWLRDALTTIGVRPINNIVDITNYILHGFGQPLHAFDADKIAGGQVIVKKCPAGTEFTTLDGVSRKLDAADLMICSPEGPMCLAGVFGGLESGVTEATTSVFVESAYFNPTTVRKSARRHGLQTDASFRYERGCDPNGTVYLARLAALMIQEIAGGEVCGDIVDIYPEPVKPFEVEYDRAKADALIGKEIPRETTDAILRSLEIEITGEKDGVASLLVPTYRVDVRRQCDVVEDVLRIYGYNNVVFPSSLHSSLSFKSFTDSADDLRRTVADQLTGQGFNEILNNSLSAESYYENCTTWPADRCVRLLNPLSSDLAVMRQTLLFGGLESVSHNVNRRNADLAMYEFGNVYTFDPSRQSTAETPLAPYAEYRRLALWLTGNRRRQGWNAPAEASSFYDLKAFTDLILQRCGLTDRELRLTQQPGDDIYAASVAVDTRSGKPLGRIGIVAAPLLKKFDIRQDVFFAELDWDALTRLALGKTVTFAPIPKTMAVKRDLALLIDSGVSMAQIEATVRESEKKLLRGVSLFDVYEGKNLPTGKKSYAITITLQDDEKTLTDKQIDAVMDKITGNLAKKTGAQLR